MYIQEIQALIKKAYSKEVPDYVSLALGDVMTLTAQLSITYNRMTWVEITGDIKRLKRQIIEHCQAEINYKAYSNR